MQHTSGIASYNYVGDFDITGQYTPQELVDWAALHGETLRIPPGSAWEYSNTNFVLLPRAQRQVHLGSTLTPTPSLPPTRLRHAHAPAPRPLSSVVGLGRRDEAIEANDEIRRMPLEVRPAVRRVGARPDSASPGRNQHFDPSAAYLDEVVAGGPFAFLSEVGPDAEPTYAGLFNIDHVPSDAFEGDCAASEPITAVAYFDHLPMVCALDSR